MTGGLSRRFVGRSVHRHVSCCMVGHGATPAHWLGCGSALKGWSCNLCSLCQLCHLERALLWKEYRRPLDLRENALRT